MTWWTQPGWTETPCMECGRRIWPEGDPDWGRCYTCFTRHLERQEEYRAAKQAEDEYWAMQEWASYATPWFDPNDPMNASDQ